MSQASISTRTCGVHEEAEIFILSDLAYAEVYFDDNNPPPSVLQVPGAIDVTVEFTSMSKTFSMAGWRMGLPSATTASSPHWRG
jgi:aspartate/methionine/tyrosine aminotransferase